jgi:hypothetical protein
MSVTVLASSLRTVRAGMLAVPSRVAARRPHLSCADVAEIDAEIRAGPRKYRKDVEQAAPNVARAAPSGPKSPNVSSMAFFKRKNPMEKLEAELSELRARAETLSNRHAAAEAAFVDAKARLQRHHLEADLDADDKARAKLEGAVAACAVTRDGYADALGEVQAQIADTEQRIATERAAAKRKAASEELARNLDAVEQALPDYLEAGRRLANALDAIHYHFEATQIATFVRNGQAQVEVAAAFVMQELHGTVGAIRDGAAPIPAPKAAAEPVAVIEPPRTETVFMMRSARFRDHAGVTRTARQYDDAEMPVQTAERALRRNVAVPVSDPRRANLKGVRGGFHPDPRAPDIVDLDDEEASRPPSSAPVTSNPHENFIVLDRSAENHTFQIDVPQL